MQTQKINIKYSYIFSVKLVLCGYIRDKEMKFIFEIYLEIGKKSKIY